MMLWIEQAVDDVQKIKCIYMIYLQLVNRPTHYFFFDLSEIIIWMIIELYGA